jgi:hypothetical protein
MKREMLFSNLAFFVMFQIGSASTESLPGAMEEIVVRTYDLSVFTESIEGYGWESSQLALIPFHPRQHEIESDLEEHLGELELEFDRIRDMIIDFIGEEIFDHESMGIDLYEDRLFVKAPAKIHDSVKGFLGLLEAWWTRKVILDLEVYSEPALKTLIMRRTLEVRLGEHVQITDGKRTMVLWDHEPEIAQGAVISEPMVEPLFLGFNFSIRPFLAMDGRSFILCLYGMSSRLKKPMGSREIRTRGYIGHEQFADEVSLVQDLDDPEIEFASLASKVVARPDAPAVIRLAFPHTTGQGNLFIKLSPRSLPPLPQVSLREGHVLLAWDFNQLEASHHIPLSFHDPCDACLMWRDYDSAWDNAIVDFGSAVRYDVNETEEWAVGLLEQMSADIYDTSEMTFNHLGDTVFLQTTPERHGEFKSVVQQVFPPEPSWLQVELSVVEAEGPPVFTDGTQILNQGRMRGVLSLPMISGGKVTAMAGLEGCMIHSYDVDVATRAAVPNPNVIGYLDGMMVHLVHEGTVHQEQQGDLRAKVYLNFLKEAILARNLKKSGGLIGDLDQPRFRRGFLDTRFAIDGKPHVLGSLSIAEDGSPKTLYVIGQSQSH